MKMFEIWWDHRLEDSEFEPIIKQQKTKPNFYYCSVHPDIINLHWQSIEHHCENSEPDLHGKAVSEAWRKRFRGEE